MPRQKTPRIAVMNSKGTAGHTGLSESTLRNIGKQRVHGPPPATPSCWAIQLRVRDVDDDLSPPTPHMSMSDVQVAGSA